ncbi:hypothetical protein K2173_005631 [Erythroxylum novogranatense]|uniref:Uncharacterized protein n=1 Tax=Erythroxylum novogranatense TaxID=1862640 RepID=A0AAV8SRA0_9ROSI|nr:hypothetical protein K2173_005631 [Erythroxylum novogranatense]
MKQTYSFTAAFGSLLLFVLTTVEARKYGLSFKPDKGVTSLSGYRNLNTTIVNSELKLSRGDRKARLTWNDFSEHGGSGKAECTEQFYPSSKRVVALSTELFRKKKTCGKTIKIYYKGKVAKAEVVDECAFKDGCKSNTIDASTGVWHDLGEHELGEVSVTWSKA